MNINILRYDSNVYFVRYGNKIDTYIYPIRLVWSNKIKSLIDLNRCFVVVFVVSVAIIYNELF